MCMMPLCQDYQTWLPLDGSKVQSAYHCPVGEIYSILLLLLEKAFSSICIHRLLRFSTLTWKVVMASLLTAHCVIHVSLQYQNRSLSGLLTSKGFRMEGRYKEISDTRGYDMLQRRQSRGHHVAINNTRHCFQPLLATSSRMQGEVAVFS